MKLLTCLILLIGAVTAEPEGTCSGGITEEELRHELTPATT